MKGKRKLMGEGTGEVRDKRERRVRDEGNEGGEEWRELRRETEARTE